jgi:hypothetical protein
MSWDGDAGAMGFYLTGIANANDEMDGATTSWGRSPRAHENRLLRKEYCLPEATSEPELSDP